MKFLPLILACSGPEAMATIRSNQVLGDVCAAIGAVVLLALAWDFYRTRTMRLTLPAAVLLLAVHPAWTVSAIEGDCGTWKREASILFTAAFLGLAIYQYIAGRGSPNGAVTPG